jgi:hypothetical protein
MMTKAVAAILDPTDSWAAPGLNLAFRRKKTVQTRRQGWAIVIAVFRLLREITLWSHFSRGIENTCLDRAHDGPCGRLWRRAQQESPFQRQS